MRTLQRLALPVMFLLLGTGLGNGQVGATRIGSINGVLYSRDGKPAPFVEVRVEGTTTGYNNSALTDDQGRFAFTGLTSGKIYTLTVELHGYLPVRRSIDLSMKRAYESITLQPDPAYQTSDLVPKGVNPVVDARLAQMPDEAKKEFEAGKKAMAQNDLSGAVLRFQKATEIYPRFAEAFELWGVLAMERGDLAHADELLQKAVEIEPKLSPGYFALGICRNVEGKFETAEKVLLHGLEMAPDSFDGNLELAKTYFAVGRYSQASDYASRAMRLQPQAPNVYLLMGYAQLRQRRTQQATDAFRQYLRLAPNGPAVSDVKQALGMIQEHERANAH